MVLNYCDEKANGIMRLSFGDTHFVRHFEDADKENTLTIAWNTGNEQLLFVDGEKVSVLPNQIVFFNVNQTFAFDQPENIIAWQFNREFYCIVDHDHEVSCAGLLFYGGKGLPVITLEGEDVSKFNLLFKVFQDEFEEPDDNLKAEMLRMLLKRLIVKLTRLYKQQQALTEVTTPEMDVVRQFNLMVEKNYRELHQVQDYADLLNRSAKTISNIFSKYSDLSPLATIHNRILLEARRLLIYTDKTTKEIAYEIGFQDIPSFSRFFKKHTQLSPSKFKENKGLVATGKN